MVFLWILAGVAAVGLLMLLISYLCFLKVFHAQPQKPTADDAVELPEGEIYKPFYPDMERWAREVRAMQYEEMSVISFDGLTLRGRYYEFAPGAPIELMFHGYRGNAERDLSGGVQRCFQLERSALVVDQRCCGRSEGSVISFGINEHRDCLTWLELMQARFGPEVKIILTGISMGAATVMTVADQPLPDNVLGILADCGYSSAREIIQTIIRQMGLPVGPSYFFVKLGARIFGRFDLEQTSPVEALKKATVPVIFFHGEDDDFVPCEMSKRCYDACSGRKMLVTVPGAGHGLSYPVAPKRYLQALRDFFGPEASAPKAW